MNFIIKFLVLATFFQPSALSASPRMTPWLEIIKPLDIRVLESGVVSVSYLQPCGAEYVGVAVRQVGQKPMQIGVTLQRRPTMCVSMPSQEIVNVFHLHAEAYKPMDGFRPNAAVGQRLRLAEIVSLVRVDERDRGILQAVFEPRCGEVVASVFNSAADGLIKVGILEQFRTAQTCPPKQMARALRFVNLPKKVELTPIDLRQRSAERDYDLRLLQVDVATVERSANGLSLPFQRRCNEVPLGAVVQQQNAASQSFRVGILVANFYNQRCPQGLPSVGDVWHQEGLHIPARASLDSMPDTSRIGLLTLRAPVAVETSPNSGRIQMTYLGGCERRLGAVYGRDVQGRPTAGVLMRRQQGSCNVPARHVAILQPISFADLSQHGKIYPMRLEGFRYFM